MTTVPIPLVLPAGLRHAKPGECRCVIVSRERCLTAPCRQPQVNDSPFCASCVDRHVDQIPTGEVVATDTGGRLIEG